MPLGNYKRQLGNDEPLIISMDSLQNKTTTPAVNLNMPESTFGMIRQGTEKLRSFEVPFLPKTSALRYLPGELAAETERLIIPQSEVEGLMQIAPIGMVAKSIGKTPIGKKIAQVAQKEVPSIFKKIQGYKVIEEPYLNRTNLDKGGFINLQDKMGKKVAWGEFWMKDSPTRAVLPTIEILDEKLRNKGIGTELLNHIEQLAKDRGATKITAQVVHAPEFFTKRGYVPVGDGTTAMVKDLSQATPKNILPLTKKLSNEAIEWLRKYGSEEKLEIPSENIIKELNQFRPKKPVKLYRAGENRDVMGWTTSKEVARLHATKPLISETGEWIGKGKKLDIQSKVFQPDEILIEPSQLPSKILRQIGITPQEEEMIVLKNVLKPQQFQDVSGKKISVVHYTDTRPRISTKENRFIPNSLSASSKRSLLGLGYGKNRFDITIPAEAKILDINKYNIKQFQQKGESLIDAGKRIYQYAKDNSFDVVKVERGLTGIDTEYAILNPTIFMREAKPEISAFQGFKDLTTKFLNYAKGKTTLSKQEIMDFAKRPELKKGEADLLNRLGNEVKEAKIPAQEFAESLKRDLLPLKPVKVKNPEYGRVNINETIPTPYERVGEAKKYLRKSENYEEVVFESPITTNGSSHYPNSKNYFAHARGDEVVEGGKKIWREQEIQSDIVQKGNLEKITKTKLSPKERDELIKLRREQGSGSEELITQSELDQLTPFTNDRFGERIMRERIREKANKGYEKYRLPTGETIGKIEGFTDRYRWSEITKSGPDIKLTPDRLKVGMRIHDDAIDWIVTDILGDGRFKAVPKSSLESKLGASTEEMLRINPHIRANAETFDLTGKSNPQYRRYSDWGKFLKNKYGGKEVVDPQGNSWIEIALKPEYAKAPVEAFGLGLLPALKERDENQESTQKRISFLKKNQ